MLLRMKAIFDCLWFGLLPYWVYEEEPHYGRGIKNYLNHAALNYTLAKAWIKGKEDEEDRELAAKVTRYFR